MCVQSESNPKSRPRVISISHPESPLQVYQGYRAIFYLHVGHVDG